MWWTILPGIIDKLMPDADAAQQAKVKLMEMAQAGDLAALNAELELAKGQQAINQAEATAPDWWRGGWRPGAGWVCVAGLAYQVLIRPIGNGVWGLSLPEIDSDSINTLLMGMLGLGGLRTIEKVRVPSR